MWIFPTKKQIKKELNKIFYSFEKRDNKINHNFNLIKNLKNQINKSKLEKKYKDLELKSLKVQISNLDLDKKINSLESRLNKRIDDILLKSLEKIESKSPNKNKSKTCLRQVQENKVISAFRKTKKQIAKERIRELKKTLSIPFIKDKLMQELGMSKASFYNYLSELNNEISIKINQN